MANMQQSFEAGQTKGKTQTKVQEWSESIQDTANAARDKAASGLQSAKESAQQAKEQTAGFMQQTGEQMRSMAQGAADGVKNTLGMGESGDKK